MMKAKKFKELYFFHPKTKIQAGEGMEEGEYPFYTSSSILKKSIDKSGFNTQALVFGTGGSASVHYANGQFNVSTDCFVASSKQEEVNIKYVYYYLAHNIHILERGFKGAGLKHISKSYIGDILINYPDLDTQNKIVVILDKVNGLIKKRKEIIVKYDELLRATFLDMFGDPVLNKMGWPQLVLSNKKYFKISGGGTPSKTNSDYFHGDIPWVTPKDMKSEIIQSSKVRITEKGLENSTSKLVDKLSTLMVVRSGILKHKIPVAINITSITVNQDLKTVTPLVTKPYFTYWCIKLHESFLLAKVRAVTADNIDTKVLTGIKIINPDTSKQEHFDNVARNFYKTKQKTEESIKEINILSNALSQLAFKGELTFNTAVDLEVLLENDYTFFKANSIEKTIQLLLDRLDKNELNDKKIYEEEIYNKAKSFVFGLLQEGRIKQAFDEKHKTLKLVLA